MWLFFPSEPPNAVYGQKGFVAVCAQGYHPESFLKGGRLFVKRFVLSMLMMLMPA
ncbi:hypothetical protein NXW50_30930 [Bacteroides thetaiotaomicron]|nr:hypothetical protein [Bacteroides thetaiotaomicron]MCS2282382.1 hypothetical protein [Bacteroides thetaiotaomicron]